MEAAVASSWPSGFSLSSHRPSSYSCATAAESCEKRSIWRLDVCCTKIGDKNSEFSTGPQVFRTWYKNYFQEDMVNDVLCTICCACCVVSQVGAVSFPFLFKPAGREIFTPCWPKSGHFCPEFKFNFKHI